LNGTHLHLVYADDVNLLGKNINTIEKDTKAVLQARREVGLEVNTEYKVYGHVSSPNCRAK
jgi:hypothetical protein